MMTDEMQYYVDNQDNVLGKKPISEMHKKRLLHRGSHVFIFNSKGELLLHKRSMKWTFPGLWDSSAGGHVEYGKIYEEPAKEELEEELGIKTKLTEVGKLMHKGNYPCNGIVTLYTGNHDGQFNITEKDVSKVKFFAIDEIEKMIKKHPEDFVISVKYGLYLYKKTNT